MWDQGRGREEKHRAGCKRVRQKGIKDPKSEWFIKRPSSIPQLWTKQGLFFLLLFNVTLPMTPTREMSYFAVIIMHIQEDFGLLQPVMLMCRASVNAFC